MKLMHGLAFTLLWIGGLNWGLVGLFELNLVSLIFGSVPILETLVYVLVAASAVYTAVTHRTYCVLCSGKTTQ